eukprot:TRINITY_DN31687_c0_g1_i1.p1 TRINITY_DN31687_c0_g1~~TRINITY_DN31687_c0_g1_i1.p1  ORF type:complete len:253 (+),score=25.25 TRINITY_DN31687_c0_g1_i1:318-1076(+)
MTDSVPLEIWSHVFSFLSNVHVTRLQIVCSDWYREGRRIIFSRFQSCFSASNALGHEMWCSSFNGRDRVPFIEFWETLRRFMGLGPPLVSEVMPVMLLRTLLVQESACGDLVTVGDFGRLLEWFGPLGRSGSVVDRARQLIATPGFVEVPDKLHSEELLAKAEPGTYLVRLNYRSPGGFVISRIARGLVLRHHSIVRQGDGKFSLKKSLYSSLDELIQANRQELNLLHPFQDRGRHPDLVALAWDGSRFLHS